MNDEEKENKAFIRGNILVNLMHVHKRSNQITMAVFQKGEVGL